MGSRHVSNVLTYSQHRGSALFVLMALATYANDNDPDVTMYASKKELAQTCRLGIRALDKVLAKLRTSGELTTSHISGTQTHEYVIHLCMPSIKMRVLQ